MLETIAIKTVFGKAMDLIAKVPREVWYALAALAAWWWFSSHYIDVGREQVKAELRDAQLAAEKTARKALGEADEKKAERAQAQARVLDEQLKAIEHAEANDENALDALF